MHDLEIWNHFIAEDVLPQRNEQIKSLHTYYVQHKNRSLPNSSRCLTSSAKRYDSSSKRGN